MSWTEERVTIAVGLWTDGFSSSQIARRLGGVSRNAVIGKLYRMGLSRRNGPSRPATMTFKPRAAPKIKAAPDGATPRSKKRVGIAGNGTVFECAPDAPLPPPTPVEVVGDPRRIADDDFGGCRWPINDPGIGRMDQTLFCCAAREGGETYCKAHRKLAYTTAGNPTGSKTAKVNDLIRSLRRYA